MTDHARAVRDVPPLPREAYRTAGSPLADHLNASPAARALTAMGDRLNARSGEAAVAQLTKRGAQEMEGELTSHRARKSTRRQTLGHADARTRRGALLETLLDDDAAPPPRNLAERPFKFAGDGTELWNGSKRFPWYGFDDLYFANHVHGVMNGGRLEYLCHTGPGTTAMLPRERDLRTGETAFATIGHIVQWRDYIASNLSPERFAMEGGTISAYPWEEAYLLYADIDNLQLEGDVYNSKTSARPYRGDPLTQEWVSFDPPEEDAASDREDGSGSEHDDG